MSMTVRAGDLPAASRVEHWQHVLDQSLGQLEVRQPGGIDARDRLRIGDAGAVRVAELTIGSEGGARRTARHIRRSDLDICKIDVLARGRGLIVQDDREARLEPGDLSFVDLSRPARWAMSAMQVVAVVFPRTLLPLRRDEVAGLTGTRIPGDRGAGALVSSVARQLAGQLGDYRAADAARLGTAVVDLLTVALAARLDRGEQVPADTRQRALQHRVHGFIERELADPELSPETIAAAHHISVRYLYKLFEPRQPSVAGWIRRRRLERCRRDLLDPALRDRPVSAIAARWGLVNAAHFSRAFRAAYGASPVEYRTTGGSGRG